MVANRRLHALLSELMRRTGQGARLGLERVREALTMLDQPQQQLAIVHVAGTNGKGSTCAMVEAIARSAGLRTGMYSSPHLCRFNERIRLNATTIDDGTFADALELSLDAGLPRLSFFESMTVGALLAMRRAETDIAILETGLGGRLDATNICETPVCTAITNIGYDHTHMLGNDQASIAREKAGILKPGSPLVLGPLGDSAATAIAAIAAQRDAAPIWQVCGASRIDGAEQVRVEEQADASLVIESPTLRVTGVRPALVGPHQHQNAAVAVGIAGLLADRFAITAGHVREGLESAHWPGRLERLRAGNGVEVLCDCAHNLDAVEALCKYLGTPRPGKTLLLIGAMETKQWRKMAVRLQPFAARRYCCEPIGEIAGKRPVDSRCLADTIGGRPFSSPAAALAAALDDAAEDDLVLVTGSIFLVGAVRAQLLDLAQDEIVPL